MQMLMASTKKSLGHGDAVISLSTDCIGSQENHLDVKLSTLITQKCHSIQNTLICLLEVHLEGEEDREENTATSSMHDSLMHAVYNVYA